MKKVFRHRKAPKLRKRPEILQLPPREPTAEDLLRACLARLEQVMRSDKSMGAVVSAIKEIRAIAKELHRPSESDKTVRICWADPVSEVKRADHA